MGFFILSKMMGDTICLTLILRTWGRKGHCEVLLWGQGTSDARYSRFGIGMHRETAGLSAPSMLTSSSEKNPKETDSTWAVVISLVCSAFESAMTAYWVL